MTRRSIAKKRLIAGKATAFLALFLVAVVAGMLQASSQTPTTWNGVLFDAHAHLLADDETRYPHHPMPPPTVADGRMPPGVAGQPGGAAGEHPVSAKPDATRMVLWMQAAHVDGMVAVQRRGTYGYDNSYVLDSTAEHPDVMWPMLVVDAEDPATPAYLTSIAKTRRLAGIRLMGGQDSRGNTPWLNGPQALRVWKQMDDSRWVVDIEINGPQGGLPFISAIVALARHYPHTTIVLDHLLDPQIQSGPDFGMGVRYQELARERKISVKFTTLVMDLCRNYGADPSAVLRKALDTFGADRVLWGSDIGTSSGTYAEMVERMLAASADLTAAEKQAVLHDNAFRLFAQPRRPNGDLQP